MDPSDAVRRLYDLSDETERLTRPGRGELVRLRTWDIFERFLPAAGTVLDVGGGPGVHAAHLAAMGFDVTLVDPVERHVEAADARSCANAPITALLGDARSLPVADGSADVVLLMGPLYHLLDRGDRDLALAEVLRVLRPGGRALIEAITPGAWLLAATAQNHLGPPELWDEFDRTLTTGLSGDREAGNGEFWAFHHRPDELTTEMTLAGLSVERLVGVEGFGWLLGELAQRMADPADLLRALRLCESDPSMLGVSAHLMAVATTA
jgi:SAM-dependent methyltransferase